MSKGRCEFSISCEVWVRKLVQLGKNGAVEYIKNRNWVTVNFLWQEEMEKGIARKERGTARFLAVESY